MSAGVPRLLDRALRDWEPTQVLRGSLDDAHALLSSVHSAVVLTGAGVSTASGVPDYRGPGAQRGRPIQYQQFIADAESRRRYWARAYQGWAAMGHADPNPTHLALTRWEQLSWPCSLTGLITQNVDGLHREAGSQEVVELHGRIHEVVCLDCGQLTGREEMQQRMAAANPGLGTGLAVGHPEIRPDGDAVVERWADFVVPPCLACGGRLKPNVVYFGEPVPPERVARCREWVDRTEALVVAGSSLSVMSGLRFVRQAAARGIPVVIVNHGATRGDELATIRLDAPVQRVLPALAGLRPVDD